MTVAIEDEIEAGEVLLWTGRPAARRWAKASAGAAAQGFVCCAAAGILPLAAAFSGAARGAFLISLIVAIAGFAVGACYMLAPAAAFARASRTLFAVTDRRALVVSRNAFGRAKAVSYPRAGIAAARAENRDGNTADIVLTLTSGAVRSVRGGCTHRALQGAPDFGTVLALLHATGVCAARAPRARVPSLGRDDLSANLQALLDRVIAPDETVGWIGQADRFRALARWCGVGLGGYGLCLFSTGLVAVTEDMKPHDPAMLLCLLAPPLLLAGLYLVALPFFEHYRAERTACVITDRRAISMTATAPQRVVSYSGADLGPIERLDLKGGYADIVLERKHRSFVWGGSAGSACGFFGISDGRAVEAMLLALTYGDTIDDASYRRFA